MMAMLLGIPLGFAMALYVYLMSSRTIGPRLLRHLLSAILETDHLRPKSFLSSGHSLRLCSIFMRNNVCEHYVCYGGDPYVKWCAVSSSLPYPIPLV